MTIKDFGLPPFGTKVIDPNGALTQPYRLHFRDQYKLYIIVGEGSPEGVVSALHGQQYMDTNGTAGNILYIKRDDGILNDPKQGWILV